jgi:hypothetical protein
MYTSHDDIFISVPPFRFSAHTSRPHVSSFTFILIEFRDNERSENIELCLAEFEFLDFGLLTGKKNGQKSPANSVATEDCNHRVGECCAYYTLLLLLLGWPYFCTCCVLILGALDALDRFLESGKK